MSIFTYSGTPQERASQALNNLLNSAGDAVPTIVSSNAQGVRDAILAEIAAMLDGSGSGDPLIVSSLLSTGAVTVKTASATALTVGVNAPTNPVFTVDASTASQVAGLKLTGAVTGGSVALLVTDSGSNANLTINAKGSGNIVFRNTGTGNVNIGGGTLPSGWTGQLMLSTGNGMTLSDSVTDATTKSSRVMFGHYTNSEEPVLGMMSNNSLTANIIRMGGGSAVANAATDLEFYTAATTTTTTGTVRMAINNAGQIGVGAIQASALFNLDSTASITSSSGNNRVLRLNATQVAAANNDVLTTIFAAPLHTPGAFTGLTVRGININSFSVAGFTSPGDPRGLELGAITGTGASNAYAIYIAPPTGATNNYLIAHSTTSTFNVTAGGSLTAANVIVEASAGYLKWGSTRAIIASPADGRLNLLYADAATFGNLLLGSTNSINSAARGVLALSNGATAPNAADADLAHIYCSDHSAGNACVSVYQEAAPSASAATASTHKVACKFNGATYYFLLTNV